MPAVLVNRKRPAPSARNERQPETSVTHSVQGLETDNYQPSSQFPYLENQFVLFDESPLFPGVSLGEAYLGSPAGHELRSN